MKFFCLKLMILEKISRSKFGIEQYNKQKLQFKLQKNLDAQTRKFLECQLIFEYNIKSYQNGQTQFIHQKAGKSENVGFANQNGKKFNFSSNESSKFKKTNNKGGEGLLSNLLEEVAFFSSAFYQIEMYQKNIQTKFQEQFQFRIQEFIQKLEQLQFSQINLYQETDENFHSYLERLETNLFKRVNDIEITQFKIPIFDFLDYLEDYLQEKLAQKRCFSNLNIEQDFLIQQIKKIYWEEGSDGFKKEKEEESNLLDNLVQRFKDFTNNEQWKIKQGLVFPVIQISTNCFSDSITSFCQEVLIQLWVEEKDQRVRNVLKNQHLIRMQMQILSKDWSTQHDRIEKKMQEMSRRIDELQEQISHEAKLNQRDLYKKRTRRNIKTIG
ncbi:unnamed protein product [Paramecium octaurelia]|uniref:Uncharacterized protein n=1 Tax=Paramecium octaurelia TaxID=43137 RepID=A0A8S1Y3T2_PAROT|nr:unnamed protein product [Paramecium octaurelia]